MAKQQHRTRINLRKKNRRLEHHEFTYLLVWWQVLRCFACGIRRWSKTIDRPIIILPITIVAPTLCSVYIAQEICRTSERLGTKKMDIKHNATFSQAFNLQIRIRNISLRIKSYRLFLFSLKCCNFFFCC